MLHDDLKKLNRYPFHMPGHKRNADFDIIGSEIDITEIDGYDNLHSTTGAIGEIEKELSEIYKSNRSFMLVNGSTVGILAAVFSLTKRGDKVIAARNCHKSVLSACFLRELDVVYIEPQFNDELGCFTYLTQSVADSAVKSNPDAVCMIITSPTYEGCTSNIKCKIPLIIDAAHGAHFGFGDFPDYPKGDIVVSSLHKTLPALTQTAVLNSYNSNFNDKIKFYLDIFETSSPSYVLMNSVSKCVEFLNNSVDSFKKYTINLNNFYNLKLKNLEIKKFSDRGKIIISTCKCNINAEELAKKLRNDYNIEPESVSINYIILMTSVADSANAFNRLAKALIEIDSELFSTEPKYIEKPPAPTVKCKIYEINETLLCPLSDSVGRISAEFVYAYPPDIPILVPGEIISEKIINSIKAMNCSGVNILSDSDLLPDSILTKAE